MQGKLFYRIHKRYPVVFVERDPKNPSKLLLEQRKFVQGKSVGELKKLADPTKWNIPVKIKGDGIDPFYAIILKDEDVSVVDVGKSDTSKWILVNAGLILREVN